MLMFVLPIFLFFCYQYFCNTKNGVIYCKVDVTGHTNALVLPWWALMCETDQLLLTIALVLLFATPLDQRPFHLVIIKDTHLSSLNVNPEQLFRSAWPENNRFYDFSEGSQGRLEGMTLLNFWENSKVFEIRLWPEKCSHCDQQMKFSWNNNLNVYTFQKV